MPFDFKPRFKPGVDFARLISDVLACGEFSRNSLATHANISRSTLFDYEKGMTPAHPVGERLIDIWCLSMLQSADAVPRRNEPRLTTPSHSA